MEYLNRIELHGIVGNVKRTEIAEAVMIKFSVMTKYAYYESEDPVVETTWHDVVYFGNDVDVRKGAEVHVDGRIRRRKWTGADGEERIAWDVYANKVEAL